MHQIKNIFPDDTKMANRVDTVEDEEIVHDDLEALQNWTITNGMKFNVDMCSVMLCGRLTETLITNFMGKKYVLQSLKKT